MVRVSCWPASRGEARRLPLDPPPLHEREHLDVADGCPQPAERGELVAVDGRRTHKLAEVGSSGAAVTSVAPATPNGCTFAPAVSSKK
jgi:hypothetical protein